MSPTPANIGAGSLDMSLRDLLTHMMTNKLDHVVLLAPGLPIRISVTIGNVEQTDEITRQVQKIFKGFIT